MKGTVVVTGIPGTGKSTVCSLVQKFAGEAGVKINLLNYGTITLEILRKRGNSTERDAMRKSDLSVQRQVQKEVAQVISNRIKQAEELTLIDTHMAIKTSGGYMPGMPSHVMQLLGPKLFVLVEAKPAEISSRRMKDSTRKRDDATEEAVQEELQFSRSMGSACAVITGAPVKVVMNSEGKAEEAAREILRTLGVT
jgi:adenylate kinase